MATKYFDFNLIQALVIWPYQARLVATYSMLLLGE